MTDEDLLALCVYEEAAGEPYEGKVAVARVIANRMAQLYESDGTVPGTVLRYDQFSWAYFSMVSGHYFRVCENEAQAANRATQLLPMVNTKPVWADCVKSVADGQIGSDFAWGPEGSRLDAEPRTLLYVNLAVSQPAWASPEAHVATIYHHSFYRG